MGFSDCTRIGLIELIDWVELPNENEKYKRRVLSTPQREKKKKRTSGI